MIKKILSLLFIILSFFCNSQTDSAFSQSNIALKQRMQFKFDSITQKFKKDSAHIYRFQKLRPFLGLDNRNSFIKDVPVNVRGIQFGVVIYERHTTGLGFYGVNSNTSKNVKTKVGTVEALTTLQLNYITLFYQYAIIDKKYFELDLPLELGMGSYDVKTVSQKDGRILQDKKGGLIPFGFGLNAVVKPIKHIGISAMIGYRLVAEKNPNLNFNGLYYSIGLAFDIRQIIRDTRFYGFKRPKYRKAIKPYSNMNFSRK